MLDMPPRMPGPTVAMTSLLLVWLMVRKVDGGTIGPEVDPGVP